MRLLIKGNAKSAKRAAARHGVPVRNCRTYKHNESSCDAPESARVAAMRWLGERGVLKAGRGYAPGSLLYFNGARRRKRRRR